MTFPSLDVRNLTLMSDTVLVMGPLSSISVTVGGGGRGEQSQTLHVALCVHVL